MGATAGNTADAFFAFGFGWLPGGRKSLDRERSRDTARKKTPSQII